MEHQHHEDNANFGLPNQHFGEMQFNQQVENVGGGRTDESGVGGPGGFGSAFEAGAKFEGHIAGEGDDEEWKYIKEKEQSEKQQTPQDLLKGFGNGDAAGHDVDMFMEHFDGHSVFNNGEAAAAATNGAKNGASLEEDVEIIKQDGELSTTNTSTTHSPGDDKDISMEGMQVEMKIESAPQQPVTEDFDEEEPSSLATNGTSSLSEHQPQHVQQHQDPLGGIENSEDRERPTELDFEMHSQLNPEAKEFVPSFGSNPASPSEMPASGMGFGNEHLEFQPSSNGAAKHLLVVQNQNDDFVAQSPHKERCADMDTVQVPAEIDFDIEAAKRPHELEELISSDAAGAGGDDLHDFHRQSPSSFVDHGPETSVDLDNEHIGEMQQVNDVMKQSIYVESTHESAEEPIENLLNTVQPLPIESESLNASFSNEQELMRQMNAEKVMLQVDEKEQVSHSPSAEEMQMNLRNNLFTAEHAEHVPTQDSPMEEEQNLIADSSHELREQQPFLQVEDRTLLVDVSNPFDSSNVSVMADTEATFEEVRNVTSDFENLEPAFEAQADTLAHPQDLQLNVDLLGQSDEAPISPSPLSTEEKHLVEDTKESPQLFSVSDDINDLVHNMGDLQLTHQNDGNSAQMEPICDIANAIHTETANTFSAPQPIQFDDDKQIDQPHSDDLLQNEQMTANEQLPQPHKADELLLAAAATEHLEQKFESKLEPAEVVAPSAAEAEPKQEKEELLATETANDDKSAAVAAAAVAATAASAVAAVAASTKKTAVAAKKSSTTGAVTTKPKAADAKKPVETTKKPAVAAAPKTTTMARPKTAPVKSTTAASSSNTVTEKKSTTSLTSAAPITRKPFTARPAPKTTTLAPRPATAHAASKTASSTNAAAAKPASLTARKATGTASAATLSAKSRSSGGASPTKPTTLGIGVASAPIAKPRQISPRTNLVATMRKSTGGTTPAAKSPTKPTSSVELASRTASTASSRSKTVGAAASTTSVTTITSTKRFIARPAPKSTLSSTAAGHVTTTTSTTTTTSRRLPATGAKYGTAADKASLTANGTTAPRKLLSTKASALSPKLSTTRTSSTGTAAKSPRTKDATAAAKKLSPAPTKSVKDAKQATATKATTNGSIEEPKLNGDCNIENGVHHSFENAAGDHAATTADVVIGTAAPEQQEATLIDA